MCGIKFYIFCTFLIYRLNGFFNSIEQMSEETINQLTEYARNMVAHFHENNNVLIPEGQMHLFLGPYAHFPENFMFSNGDMITLKSVINFVKNKIKLEGYTSFRSQIPEKKLLMNSFKSIIGICFDKNDRSLVSANQDAPNLNTSSENAIAAPQELLSHLEFLVLKKLIKRLEAAVGKHIGEKSFEYHCSADVKTDSITGI